MDVPRAGTEPRLSRTMRGYGQSCPIARGAEIFAERWMPIIVRNLHRGCHTFSESQTAAVIRFDIPDMPKPKQYFWRLVQRPQAEVCIKSPRFEEHIVVTATSEWLAKRHRGWVPLAEAQQRGGIRVDGSGDLVRRLPTWAVLSHVAAVVPVHAEIVSKPLERPH